MMLWQEGDQQLRRKSGHIAIFRAVLLFAVFFFGWIAIFAGLLAEQRFTGMLWLTFILAVVNCLFRLLIRMRPQMSNSALQRGNAILIFFDIALITAAIHATQGIDSDLVFLYLIPIVLASNVYERWGVYITALGAGLFYGGLLAWENFAFLHFLLGKDSAKGLASAYASRLWTRVILRSSILLITAMIWAAFFERLSRVAQENARRLARQLVANEQLLEELTKKNYHLDAKNLELGKMQAQMVHQEKMASLGRTVAGIAHELNNPVNFVYGNLPYLREYIDKLKQIIACSDDLPAKDKQRMQVVKDAVKYEFLVTDLDNILIDLQDGTERIRQIIMDLRSFSRLDEAELKEASIEEGIESTIKILSQHFGVDRIKVVRNYRFNEAILCYPGKLNQVWMNLLSNAADAMENQPDPLVIVSTERQNNSVLITIEDNGSGIAVADQSKIFDPFFTTKPVGKGTGLGLSICHSIVEQHAGRIWLENRANRGCCFCIQIPLDTRNLTDITKVNELIEKPDIIISDQPSEDRR